MKPQAQRQGAIGYASSASSSMAFGSWMELSSSISPSISTSFIETSRHSSTAPFVSRSPINCGTGSPDRFISNRNIMDFEGIHHVLATSEHASQSPPDNSYSSFVKSILLDEKSGSMGSGQSGSSFSKRDHLKLSSRFLKFGPSSSIMQGTSGNVNSAVNFQAWRSSTNYFGELRRVHPKPLRVLDAPNVVNDFYINIMDWGSANIIAVCLKDAVFTWDATRGSIRQMTHLASVNYADNGSSSKDGRYYTAVKFAPDGKKLVLATSEKEIEIWDVQEERIIRRLSGSHHGHCGSLAWLGPIVSSGSSSADIVNHDVRVKDHEVSRLIGHNQEICGLSWRDDGYQLASGANDSVICIWDSRSQGFRDKWSPKLKLYGHNAAIKALAWSPHHSNVIASGGGTADRQIRVWSSITGKCLRSVDTGSQVCSLLWSRHDNEILSAHGFCQNHLSLWKYPQLVRMADFQGHLSRVLHMSVSPDGRTVASLGADKILCLWHAFYDSIDKNNETSEYKKGVQTPLSRSRMNVR